MKEVVKLTVNLTPEAAAAVQALAVKQGTTVTNIINRSIALEKFVWEEKEKGNHIQVEDKNGKIRELILR
jgi:hypothetical protein